jgi:hypothetical protein
MSTVEGVVRRFLASEVELPPEVLEALDKLRKGAFSDGKNLTLRGVDFLGEQISLGVTKENDRSWWPLIDHGNGGRKAKTQREAVDNLRDKLISMVEKKNKVKTPKEPKVLDREDLEAKRMLEELKRREKLDRLLHGKR